MLVTLLVNQIATLSTSPFCCLVTVGSVVVLLVALHLNIKKFLSIYLIYVHLFTLSNATQQ